MGDGADKVLAAFARYGIEVSGVFASDGFVRGQRFHEFTVKRLEDLEGELRDFAVALCFASSLPDVMAQMKRVAAKHETRVPSVPVFGDTLMDDDFIAEHRDDMEKAYDLLADEQSRRVYEAVLAFYYTGELEWLDAVTTDKDEAFKILNLGDNEVYVDLGAYNGDTIDEFLHYSGGTYRKIIALEPNAKNFEKLKAHCADRERVTLWQLGAWSENTTLIFNNKAGRNSAVKADVEGADYETLLGMKNTLKAKPKLNFAAYHRTEDIFRLPLLIHALNPTYRIFLRHHPYIPAWDTNLYCI